MDESIIDAFRDGTEGLRALWLRMPLSPLSNCAAGLALSAITALGCANGSESSHPAQYTPLPNAATGGNATALAGTAGAAGTYPLGQLHDYLADKAYPDDFWQTASLAEAHVNAGLLQQALDKIKSAGWEIHSFLVARGGRLILEQYGFNSGTTPGDPNPTPRQSLPSERHQLWSTTKSFTSALIGIAMDQGLIANVDVKAADYFTDYATLDPNPEKSAITLADLLTMRSGLAFTEGEQAVFDAPDPARAMLSRPVVDTPVGTIWNYSTGGSEIVAEMLRMATGHTPLEFADLNLFGPLGIVNAPWSAGQSGTSHGGFGLALTSREMARFGELYRNAGVWAGKSVVSAAWTNESTLSRCATPWGRHYGYHWWIPDLPGFFNTVGAWGQEIFVSRDQGLVIVFTANLPNETADSIFEALIRDFVVPAME